MKLTAGAGARHVRSGRKPIGSYGDKPYHAFGLIDPIANAQIKWAAQVRHMEPR
jgi:hypothetical protein